MSQSRKQKAGETTLEGAGIALITSGVGILPGDEAVGAIAVAIGFLCLYASRHYRNISVFVDTDDVVDSIDDVVGGNNGSN